jgi:hypothetical protein
VEAKIKYMSMDHVKAISIKSNDLGYYFELTLSMNDPSIEQYYHYLLNDGTPQSIPIKIVVLAPDDKIIAQSINLSARIFDMQQPDNWGTLGVFVKPLEENSPKRYLLTCCHNVIKPLSKLPYDSVGGQIVTAGILNGNVNAEIGTVFKAERDHEIDAALIAISPEKLSLIKNTVPKMGPPQKARKLADNDAGKVRAYIYGAKTGPANRKASEGMVTSIYNEIKITYNSTNEFTIINTIAISENGKSITEGGDSGACVLDRENNILGLVVAGSREVTYILPIDTLLRKLKVQIA